MKVLVTMDALMTGWLVSYCIRLLLFHSYVYQLELLDCRLQHFVTEEAGAESSEGGNGSCGFFYPTLHPTPDS